MLASRDWGPRHRTFHRISPQECSASWDWGFERAPVGSGRCRVRGAAGARALSNHAIYRVRCDDPPAMTLGLHVHVTYPDLCACARGQRVPGGHEESREIPCVPVSSRMFGRAQPPRAATHPGRATRQTAYHTVQGGGIRPLSSASCRERMASSRSSCSRSYLAAGELIRVRENDERKTRSLALVRQPHTTVRFRRSAYARAYRYAVHPMRRHAMEHGPRPRYRHRMHTPWH